MNARPSQSLGAVAVRSAADGSGMSRVALRVVGDHPLEGTDQVRARPCDPRADRPDGAADHRRRLGVGQAEQLGQHEGLPPVGVQPGEEVVDRRALGYRVAVPHSREALEVRVVADEGEPPAATGADGVGADPAGDGQQPRPDGRAVLEAVQRAERPQVGLLGQVVGVLVVAEGRAQPPDVGLGGAHQRRGGEGVALGGVGGEAFQVVHVLIFVVGSPPRWPIGELPPGWEPYAFGRRPMRHDVLSLPRGPLRPPRRRSARDVVPRARRAPRRLPRVRRLGRPGSRRHAPIAAGHRAARARSHRRGAGRPPARAPRRRGGGPRARHRLGPPAGPARRRGRAGRLRLAGAQLRRRCDERPGAHRPRDGSLEPGRRGRLPGRRGRAPPGGGRPAGPRLLRRPAPAGDPGRPRRRARARRTGGGASPALRRGGPPLRRGVARSPPVRARPGRPAGAGVRRSWLVVVALLAAWLAGGVAIALPASAHATLVSTDPGEGARLESVPGEVRLEFSEGVSLGAGYARVLGADGERVDTDAAAVQGSVLTIPLRDGLGDDGYLVTYRVISADSHPISGAYSFVVGDGELVPTAGAEDPTDPVVRAALPAARWIGFAGLALAVGVPVLVLLCWPGGWASDRLRRLAGWGAAAVAVSALLSFLLQGPYSAGTGLGSVLDPSLLSATGSSVVGWTLLARAVLAGALVLAVRPVWRRGTPPSPAETAGAGLLVLGLVVATAAIGHPVAGSWPGLAVVVATVHAAGMAVWLGGLAGLLAVVLRPTTPGEELAEVLTPWSRLAFGAVVALVVTGTVQAVREVESPTALFATTYGWVLIAKLLLVAALLAAAGVSRVWVQQRLGVHRPRPGGRRSVTAHAFAASSGGPSVAEDEQADLRRRQQAE